MAKNRDKIGLYLAATAYPDDETLSDLARVLDVSVEELAGKQVKSGQNAIAPGATLFWTTNPGPRRASGPSLSPVPGRPGMFRLQVDQILDWRLAMKLFEELNTAAEAEGKPGSADEGGSPDEGA